MKSIMRLLCVPACAALVFCSCAKTESESVDKYETIALGAYMQKYEKELVQNFQPVGNSGYYIDILDLGDQTAKPLGDADYWVTYDFSGRDLSGNIILSRDVNDARLGGAFSKYTHYVPYFRHCGATNGGLLEGAYLAMRSTIKLGDDYAKSKGYPTEVRLRKGSKVVLYMPSMLVGSGGLSGSGGYEGQYSLSSQRPFRVEMMIRDTITDVTAQEGERVDKFCDNNGGKQIFNKKDNPIPTDPTKPNHPYNLASPRWATANDTIPHVYVNYRFDPKTDRLTYPSPYTSPVSPYNNMTKLEEDIAAALEKRFHASKEYVGVAALTSDSIKLSNTATIWYIGRFPDGFIFDTNIPEVQKLIYDKQGTSTTGLSYRPSDGSMIQAFYYTVPHLRYGQWAALITSSANAYGTNGKSGSGSTSVSNTGLSSDADYVNYMRYVIQEYSKNAGGIYKRYYSKFFSGYYGAFTSSTVNTTPTYNVSTEIPPYSSLIFEMYVEPKK